MRPLRPSGTTPSCTRSLRTYWTAFHEALTSYRKAVSIAEASGDPNPEIFRSKSPAWLSRRNRTSTKVARKLR
jgi:hypothetical protein